MNRTKQDEAEHSFLFQVDILVKAKSNGSALERLLHVLNNGDFADYRIVKGIQLGQVIEEALKREQFAPGPETQRTLSAQSLASDPPKDELGARIQYYIDTNKLIRLSVNKGRGVKLSIPCRILRFDDVGQLLTVYHVDEKQVHTLKLFEIDDFHE